MSSQPHLKIGDVIETTCEHGLPGFRVLRAKVDTPEALAFAQRLVDEERWRIIEVEPLLTQQAVKGGE